MTPQLNRPLSQNEGEIDPATATLRNNPTLSPPLSHQVGRIPNSHTTHKNTSVTSNPAKVSDLTLLEDHIQGSRQLYSDLTQSHDYMSSVNLEHDFGPSTQQSLSFDDLMTPEYSDNHISEHTTPQELIWEQQFLPQDSDHPQIYQPNDFGSPQNPQSPSTDFKGIFSSLDRSSPKFVSESQLLSPQLTSPSSPGLDLLSSSKPQDIPRASGMGQTGQKRGVEPLQVSTNQSVLVPQPNGSSPNQRPVSPNIVVSSHPRGDSPARPQFPRPRSSSKRGRESALHQSLEYNENATITRSPRLSPIEPATCRLAPPDPFESEAYDDLTQARTGIDPGQRGAEQVASVNDLAEQRKIDEKNADVEDWLSKSETGSVADESHSPNRGTSVPPERPRAHSTGLRLDAMGLPIYSDRHVPGPGVLLDEDSQDEYSENESASVTGSESSLPAAESPPVPEEKLKDSTDSQSYFPSFPDDIAPEMQEPLPKQFFRRTPWQDPVRGPIMNDTRDQPHSSNAAAMRYNQEVTKWETASRAATWGTRRRMSESEINAIVDGSRVRHMSLAKRGRERGNSILNKARGLIPRRSNSNIKKGAESPPKDKSPDLEAPTRRDTGGSMKTLSRMSSSGKSRPPRSPPLETATAFMAMTGNLAAVGQGSTATIEPSQLKSDGLRSPLQILRKVRSKSDVGKSPSKAAGGLAELITRHGGPPMPALASPAQNTHHLMVNQSSLNDGAMEDGDDDELLDEVGIKMDFKVRAENIIPNYEGFRSHARQLNPRLEPYLIDRIGQEQVRRYKKLVDNKIKHTRAVQIAHKCASGKHCFGLGGEATMLPPRISPKDPEATYTQFQITNPGEEEVDEAGFDEGIVTPALFPPGIPLPPVKRLPAEFECTLCFKVKKFQKPSDWTKHVHEDIQPFSCTFPNCNEPKSFKRKADWVRHENERHRRLEYWKCNVQECSHICYRKDNFVQHLVREHKKTEPKVKRRGSGSSKAKPANGNGWQTEDSEVWRLVEMCRFETSSKPRDEPCRFCGNICNSWKKLSVHMGKHMEQIAMPVLEVVNMKEVAPDTVISPIEQNYQQIAGPPSGVMHAMANTVEHQPSLSPYAVSAHSYQNSSAGQSPSAVHSSTRYGYEQPYYGPHGLSISTQSQMGQRETYANTSMYTANAGYTTGGMAVSNQFGSINTQLGSAYSGRGLQTPASAHSIQGNIPRSQPMGNSYHGNSVTASAGASYNTHHMNYSSSPSTSPYHPYATTANPGSGFGGGGGPLDSDQHYDMASHPSHNEYVYNVHQVGNTENSFQYT